MVGRITVEVILDGKLIYLDADQVRSARVNGRGGQSLARSVSNDPIFDKRQSRARLQAGLPYWTVSPSQYLSQFIVVVGKALGSRPQRSGANGLCLFVSQHAFLSVAVIGKARRRYRSVLASSDRAGCYLSRILSKCFRAFSRSS